MFQVLMYAIHAYSRRLPMLDFEIEIKGDNPIGVQLIKAIIFFQINFN